MLRKLEVNDGLLFVNLLLLCFGLYCAYRACGGTA